jgi:hypothetical protein
MAMIDYTNLKPHPFLEVVPLMWHRDYKDLVEDIREVGIKYPIVLHEGMILDGRSRYRAAQEIGLTLSDRHFVEFCNFVAEGTDPAYYACWANNFESVSHGAQWLHNKKHTPNRHFVFKPRRRIRYSPWRRGAY